MTEPMAIALAYLLGSVPFALLAARAKGVDLRAHGSGNLGATNAIRVLGPGLGVPVLLADIAKGLVSVTALPALAGGAPRWLPVACGAAAIAGHVASVFLRFKGGKGVATAAGAFAGMAPWATGVAAAAFTVLLLTTRYVSLASIVAALVLPLALRATGAPLPMVIAGAAVAGLVVMRHRANLGRLFAGTESRVTFGAGRRRS